MAHKTNTIKFLGWQIRLFAMVTKPAKPATRTFNWHWTADEDKWASLVNNPSANTGKQTNPDSTLKNTSELYNFRLNRRLAEVFAAADRILQIRRRLRRPQLFRRIFGGGKNSADPDIRRRLGSLPRRNFAKLFDARKTRIVGLPCAEETVTIC